MAYSYLTRSYVEHLGLQRVPVLLPLPVTAGFVSPNSTKPKVTADLVVDAVEHDGRLYEREPDGLAFAMMATSFFNTDGSPAVRV